MPKHRTNYFSFSIFCLYGPQKIIFFLAQSSKFQTCLEGVSKKNILQKILDYQKKSQIAHHRQRFKKKEKFHPVIVLKLNFHKNSNTNIQLYIYLEPYKKLGATKSLIYIYIYIYLFVFHKVVELAGVWSVINKAYPFQFNLELFTLV